MTLSYKQQLIFTDGRSNSVTVSIGDIVEIKGHEYISHKDVEIIGKVEDFDLGRWKEIIIVDETINEEYHFHLDQIENIEKLYWTPKMIKGITEEIQSKYPNIKLQFKGNKYWMIMHWDSDDEDKEYLTDDEFNDFIVVVGKFLSKEDIKNKLTISRS